ncbi:hypothetical protein EB118_24075, partial [bacterium]|nr:hypothetical protein [bacterium]
MARPRKKKTESKFFVDGHGDVREVITPPQYEPDDGPLTDEQLAQLPVQPIQQFEIDWDKIAENVREAALMVETTTTEETKPKRTRKK